MEDALHVLWLVLTRTRRTHNKTTKQNEVIVVAADYTRPCRLSRLRLTTSSSFLPGSSE